MRLIDADALVFDYSGLVYIPHSDGRGIAKYFADQVTAAPTIELERKKGKWIFPYETTKMVSHCSECGAYGNSKYNYCPNCGAQMEEGGE